jgi:hypothetical protein
MKLLPSLEYLKYLILLSTIPIGNQLQTNWPSYFSKAGLKDLQECMNKTKQQLELVQGTNNAFSQRLLKPGTTTEDILEM